MAYIEPFRALRYDPTRVALAQVATQPYDKITPEMQDAYYASSPYNLVRIILGKRNANDGPADNPYTRAAAHFSDWRRQGIFFQDSQPSLYRYTQEFHAPAGKGSLERHGFIALGKVEDYAAGVVFRHEQTLAKPKADRLDLLRATRAHFGQIFMLYSDPAAEIENALASAGPPLMEINDEYAVLHRVWGISDPAIVALVRGKMRDKKLIIADGHHRYETALTYRNERRQSAMAGPQTGGMPRELGKADGVSPELAPYELAMMTFVIWTAPAFRSCPLTAWYIASLHSRWIPCTLEPASFSASKKRTLRSTHSAPRQCFGRRRIREPRYWRSVAIVCFCSAGRKRQRLSLATFPSASRVSM